MLNRRKLIESTLAVAVLGSSSTALARGSVADKPWTAEHFQQRIGQRFQLTGPSTGLATLTAVERCPSDACTDSFHLRFEAECNNPVEGIYQLSHPLRGKTSLFMQPRGEQAGRWVLEATVTRLLG